MEVRLLRATQEDAPLIHRMQREAFAALLETYQDFETNPACESLERVAEKLAQPFTFYYLILADGQTAGAIRVVDQGDGSDKRISPLFVLPAFRGRGGAQAAIRACEDIHGPRGWSLATIAQEKGNCHLYEKMGYQRTEGALAVNERMTLVFYSK